MIESRTSTDLLNVINEFIEAVNKYIDHDLFQFCEMEECRSTIAGYMRYSTVVRKKPWSFTAYQDECVLYVAHRGRCAHAEIVYTPTSPPKLITVSQLVVSTSNSYLDALKEELRLEKRAESLPGVLSI